MSLVPVLSSPPSSFHLSQVLPGERSRSRSPRSPSITPTLVQLSPLRRAPPSPVPSLVPTLELSPSPFTPTLPDPVRAPELPNAPELDRRFLLSPCAPTLVAELPEATPPLEPDAFAQETKELIDLLMEEPEEPPQPVAPPLPPPTPSAPLFSPPREPPLAIGERWWPLPELAAAAKAMHDRILAQGIPEMGAPHIDWCEFAPPLGVRLDRVFHEAVTSCVGIVRRDKYYIGVTMDPFWRFYGHAAFKHHHVWRCMTVLAVSTSSGIIRLERMVLADPRVGRTRYKCTNIGEGGEAVRTDGNVTIPYFLYVVYGAY